MPRFLLVVDRNCEILHIFSLGAVEGSGILNRISCGDFYECLLLLELLALQLRVLLETGSEQRPA